MRALVVLAVCACGGSRPPAAPPPAPAVDAGVAQAPPVEASYPNDPPEPAAPTAECTFDSRVTCQPGVPTRTALQPHPFEWCAHTLPAPDAFGQEKQFSARQTRRARAKQADACCYLEYHATACD